MVSLALPPSNCSPFSAQDNLCTVPVWHCHIPAGNSWTSFQRLNHFLPQAWPAAIKNSLREHHPCGCAHLSGPTQVLVLPHCPHPCQPFHLTRINFFSTVSIKCVMISTCSPGLGHSVFLFGKLRLIPFYLPFYQLFSIFITD